MLCGKWKRFVAPNYQITVFCILQVESAPLSDVSVQGTEIAQVRSTQIQVESTGFSVNTRDSSHASTNHYIKESRPFFPNEKLPIYIDFPYFYCFSRLLCFASLLGAMAAGGGSKYLYLPVGFFAACLLFFFIYCQHEWVNQKSLPFVLKQPVIENQRSQNCFYEVTVTELDGIALHNYEAGVGFVQLSQGTIKFQAFNRIAIRKVSNSKRRSRWMLCLLVAASLYNCYFMVSYTLGAGPDWLLGNWPFHSQSA